MSSSSSHVDHRDLLEPELHVIGEVTMGFKFRTTNAFCKWDVSAGPTWLCVGGDESGQTQVDYAGDGGHYCWNHPLDLHYYTKSIQGWPRFKMEVWHLDEYGVQELIGYAFCFVPMQPGVHDLEVDVWCPVGNDKDELFSYFLGVTPQLLDKEIVSDCLKAKNERNRIFTKTAGTVNLHLEVILRNLDAHHVKM
jgi:B9 domain-containing protein 2